MPPWAQHVGNATVCAAGCHGLKRLDLNVRGLLEQTMGNKSRKLFFTKANQKNEERSVGRMKSDGEQLWHSRQRAPQAWDAAAVAHLSL